MSTSFIVVAHILAYLSISIQEGLKLVLAVAFIFQDCMERLNMCVHVGRIYWNSFVQYSKLVTGGGKSLSYELRSIVRPYSGHLHPWRSPRICNAVLHTYCVFRCTASSQMVANHISVEYVNWDNWKKKDLRLLYIVFQIHLPELTGASTVTFLASFPYSTLGLKYT